MNTLENEWKFHGHWIKGSDIDYGEDDHLYYERNHNVVLNKDFIINEGNQTHLYIAVLGYYIVYINNQRVGNFELNSDWTNFEKCVYYDDFDITPYVKEGTNTISIELGNGMYNPAPLKLFGKYNLRTNLKEIGEPRIICDITQNDKIIISSNQEWNYTLGNIIFNNLYLGETADNTYSSNQIFKVEVDKKKRKLKPSYIPKIKQHAHIRPVICKITDEGIIYDFGETISGFIDIQWIAKDKQEIVLQYSENMKQEKMDYSTCLAGSVGQIIGQHKVDGGLGCPKEGIQTDKVISREGKNHFINKFTYHSFRYVLITGIDINKIEKIEAIYVHTSLKQTGHVELDNEYLKELYDVANRTKLNNVHSTFEDCARERLGYGGDMVALASSNLYTFDMDTMYKKIIDDFIFDQTALGGTPETAPFMGIGTNGIAVGEGPILWQLVLPYLLYKHMQFYGDKKFIKSRYSYAKKQLDYVLSYDIETLAQHCIGDHGSVLISGNFRQSTPDKEMVGYCTILLFLKYNIILMKQLDINTSEYCNKFNELKEITINKFSNSDGTFGEKTQTGLAFASVLELNDGKELCKKLVERIQKDDYVFNSGIFGMMFSYEVLNKYGYDNVIEKWLLNEGEISYFNMLSRGNKVLSELFKGEHQSLNHAMFASYQQWYYQGLGGIQINDDAIGFDKYKIKPYFSNNVNNFKCLVETKKGNIESSWSRRNEIIHWKISSPEEIEIVIPNGYIVVENRSGNKVKLIKLKKEK
ncbi:MAG: family 78 glycoside hydrolase catalytic domain [Coprobacillaceae bacterium]